MVNYQNGKIYKIEDVGGNMCYIGSTTKDFLSKRMVQHRCMYKKWKEDSSYSRKTTSLEVFEKYGIDNCRIVLIELYPCDTKDELTRREAHYIKTIECVNKVIPHRTKQQWTLEHVDEKRIYDHEYYQNTKEHKQKLIKQNYVLKKEAIKEKRKEIIECGCGITYTRCNKSQHMKTKYHLDNTKNEPLDV